MKAKISVITISYNCKDAIEKTIRSVLGQNYDNTEYVIIDGNSTDGTTDVIEKYRDQIDYYVSEKDRGIYDAMNKGIAAATGDWVIFMNAGDFFAEKDVLQKVSDLIDEDSVVVYGDIIIQCSGYYYIGKPNGVAQIARSMPVFHQSALVRLGYHKKHLFDTSFKSSGDYDFFYKCHFEDKCKFQYVPITIACFDNSEGMSKDNHGLSLHENLRIWGKTTDWTFRLKQEFHLFVYHIIMWIKRKCLSQDKRRKVEINRIKRNGKTIIIGEYSWK